MSLITYSVHSLSAVNNLLMVFEVISRTCCALGDVSSISEIAATALATTYNKNMLKIRIFTINPFGVSCKCVTKVRIILFVTNNPINTTLMTIAFHIF